MHLQGLLCLLVNLVKLPNLDYWEVLHPAQMRLKCSRKEEKRLELKPIFLVSKTVILNPNILGMYGFDFANLSNRFAFGGGDGLVGVASINKNEK